MSSKVYGARPAACTLANGSPDRRAERAAEEESVTLHVLLTTSLVRRRIPRERDRVPSGCRLATKLGTGCGAAPHAVVSRPGGCTTGTVRSSKQNHIALVAIVINGLDVNLHEVRIESIAANTPVSAAEPCIATECRSGSDAVGVSTSDPEVSCAK